MKTIKGNLVDVVKNKIYQAIVHIENGTITKIEETTETYSTYLLPGIIDSHIHIESTLLTPEHYAREAVRHGVIGAVADPHEIANVLGTKGVDFMIENGNRTPFYFWFGAPSCVPSTPLEAAGAKLGPAEIEELLSRKDVHFLAEMMDYPSVIGSDKEVMSKIASANRHGKPIDGHAPMLSSSDVKQYAAAGISTDHECTTIEEAIEKMSLGMKVLIREGSAARNFDALHPIIATHPNQVMFCCDDMPAETLLEDYLPGSIRKAIGYGYNPLDVIRCASLNVANHYAIPAGMLQEGDSADFIEIDSLSTFNILKTFIKGNVVFDQNEATSSTIDSTVEAINRFDCEKISIEDIQVKATGKRIKVIDCVCGDLLTETHYNTPKTEKGYIISNPDEDILKLVAINRYFPKEISVGFIRGIGIKNGAMATSISHDNHNLVVVGVSDEDIVKATNLLIENKGGMVITSGDKTEVLQLEIAGLMTHRSAKAVAHIQEQIKTLVSEMGSELEDPFLTLSFMSLIVIPKIKLSSKGLFDVQKFEFTSLFEE